MWRRATKPLRLTAFQLSNPRERNFLFASKSTDGISLAHGGYVHILEPIISGRGMTWSVQLGPLPVLTPRAEQRAGRGATLPEPPEFPQRKMGGGTMIGAGVASFRPPLPNGESTGTAPITPLRFCNHSFSQVRTRDLTKHGQGQKHLGA